MGRIVTRTTPVGELVPACDGDLAYPAVSIHLRTDDGDDVLLGVVEFDKAEKTLNWLRWDSLARDDAEPVRFSLPEAEVRRQLDARRTDRENG